jgi:hypothetical protein
VCPTTRMCHACGGQGGGSSRKEVWGWTLLLPLAYGRPSFLSVWKPLGSPGQGCGSSGLPPLRSLDNANLHSQAFLFCVVLGRYSVTEPHPSLHPWTRQAFMSASGQQNPSHTAALANPVWFCFWRHWGLRGLTLAGLGKALLLLEPFHQQRSQF